MSDKIIYTTLEEQGKTLREYSTSLSPIERLRYLQELNLHAFGVHENTSMTFTLKVFVPDDHESLEVFLQRVKKEKRATTQ